MVENKFSLDGEKYPSCAHFTSEVRVPIRGTSFTLTRKLTERGKAVGNLYWTVELQSLGALSHLLGSEDKAVKWINSGGDIKALSKEISDEILFPMDDEGKRVDSDYTIGSDEYFSEFASRFEIETSDIEKATGERQTKSVELIELSELQARWSEIEYFLKTADGKSLDKNNVPIPAAGIAEVMAILGERTKISARIEEIKEIRSTRRAENKAKNAAKRKAEATPAV